MMKNVIYTQKDENENIKPYRRKKQFKKFYKNQWSCDRKY